VEARHRARVEEKDRQVLMVELTSDGVNWGLKRRVAGRRLSTRLHASGRHVSHSH